MFSPSFLELLGVRYLILAQAQTIPGFHVAAPQTTTTLGNPALLLKRDSVVPYAGVMLNASKTPEGAEVATLLDSRFPMNDVALFADTSSVRVDSLVQPIPRSQMTASVSRWLPGAMTITLKGADARAGHLVVSENWYPDWHATVDGKPAVVRRADHTLISVDLPAGAREVRLWFAGADYARAKIVSLLSLLIAAGMFGAGAVRDRQRSRVSPA